MGKRNSAEAAGIITWNRTRAPAAFTPPIGWSVSDTRLVNRYSFFVLEVIKAWIDPAIKVPRTLHHRGRGVFMVAGRTIKLPSKMK